MLAALLPPLLAVAADVAEVCADMAAVAADVREVSRDLDDAKRRHASLVMNALPAVDEGRGRWSWPDVVKDAVRFGVKAVILVGAAVAVLAVVPTRDDVNALRTDMAAVRAEVPTREGVAELHDDVNTLRADVGALRADIGALRADMRADIGKLIDAMHAIDKRLVVIEHAASD